MPLAKVASRHPCNKMTSYIVAEKIVVEATVLHIFKLGCIYRLMKKYRGNSCSHF